MAHKPKSSNKTRSSNKSKIEIIIAKYGLISTIAVAMLGLIGTGITAYLGYLGIQTQIEKPTQTAEARAIVDSTQTAIESSLHEYTIVYPSCNCDEYIESYEKVLIRLRWGGMTAEQAEMGADFIKQVVIINGENLEDIKNYRRPAVYVKDPIVAGDPSDAWWVYWDIPFGRSYNDINIELSIELLTGIDTGWDVLPAGLTKKYHVIANLIELPATKTRTPNTPTPTPLPIPSGYVVLDQFGNQELDDKNWKLFYPNAQNIGNCSADEQNGYLHMECSESKQGSYWLEYTSQIDNMRQLSGGNLSGIAMSAKLVSPNQGEKVKVHFVIHFASADGTTNTRVYFMDMRSIELRIAEAYPLEGYRSRDLVLAPIDSTVSHIMRVEYKSNQLTFFIDGQPVVLKVQPDLPNGSTWKEWAFGVGVDNPDDQPVTVESLIDWIAVSTGQTQ